MNELSVFLGIAAGALATYWRSDNESYVVRFLKAVVPLLLAMASVAVKQ